MMMHAMMVAAATSMALAAQEPQLDVTVYRSWRPPNLTLVDGMFRVDPALLGTSDCAYGVTLTVRDEAGTQLTREQWKGRCPVNDGTPAAALETFRFQVLPSTYTVELEVYPESRPERKRSRTLQVSGLRSDPVASDLILARDVGFVDTAKVDPWTLRRGEIGLQTSSQIVVQPDEPKLAYYLELYPEQGEAMTGRVVGSVRRRDGRELAQFELQNLDRLAEHRPVAGEVSVEGLPPGAYTFETRLQLADTTVVRSHPFYVAAPVAGVQGRGWFWTLSDAELSERFDPVVAWLTKAEMELYASLPPDARREFLTRQFGTEGPTPNDGQESALDAFLQRAATVRQQFGERVGRGDVASWQTDRGRVYMRRGQPAQVISRPAPQSGAAYELWQYTGQQPYVYLFADETRMGHFRLIFTTDPNEQGVQDWERWIGREATQDLDRMGVRPRIDPPDLQR